MKRRRQAAKFSRGAPPSSPTTAAPPTTPPSSRSPRATSTSAPPSSARAPPLLPVDCRRLPLGRRPFSRGPPLRRRPRSPRRLAAPPTERHRTSSLPGWSPPPRRPLPQPLARTRRRLLRRRRKHHRRLRRQRRPRSPPTPHLVTARDAWRPGIGPAAQQRQPLLPGWCFFFHFFQNAITCVKNVDK
jgi:hypothetical protein